MTAETGNGEPKTGNRQPKNGNGELKTGNRQPKNSPPLPRIPRPGDDGGGDQEAADEAAEVRAEGDAAALSDDAGNIRGESAVSNTTSNSNCRI